MIENIEKNKLSNIPGFDGHEQVVRFSDPHSGLLGFVAIHNTALGPAVGGTRMNLFKTEQEALEDALKLSRAMTYKCALSGLHYGGGKAVIIGDPHKKSSELLEAYGVIIENLGGKIRTGVDAGVEDEDVSVMATKTKYMIGVVNPGVEKLHTSDMAALGVFHSIKTCFKIKFGSNDLSGKTIAIRGVGKLGGELLRLLYERGAKIFAADIETQRMNSLKSKYPGLIEVPVTEIHKVECDLFSPCSLGGEINSQTILELKTKIICGGSNNQLARPEMAHELYNQGVLYAPDYVVNAGGLINVVDELEPDGYRKERVLQRVENIGDILENILHESEKEKMPASLIADRMAGRIIYDQTLKKLK